MQISDQVPDAGAMEIRGLDGLSRADLDRELAAGGRFVFYEYCISLVFISLRRASPIYFLRGRQYGVLRSWRYSLLSLFLGWWGVPWGFVYTPLTLVTNLWGGCNITEEVQAFLQRHPEWVSDNGVIRTTDLLPR